MKRRPPDGLAYELGADRALALSLTPVSRETAARLDQFVALLLRWQAKMNLVAQSALRELWTRHIADSLQLLSIVPGAKEWVDLGSGGGFPGIVIACALADEPNARVHLVESNARKAAFLRQAVQTIAVPALVHAQRIEDFVRAGDAGADVVTARALAPLNQLLAYAEPLLKRGAKALFLKGQDVVAELTEASKYWSIQAELLPSKTDPEGRIVLVRGAVRSSPSIRTPNQADSP